MNDIKTQKMLSYLEKAFDILFIIESIIKLTRNNFINNENNSSYYTLSHKEIKELSEERNNCINMLNIVIEKLDSLKELNAITEKELNSYKITPTIAADK